MRRRWAKRAGYDLGPASQNIDDRSCSPASGGQKLVQGIDAPRAAATTTWKAKSEQKLYRPRWLISQQRYQPRCSRKRRSGGMQLEERDDRVYRLLAGNWRQAGKNPISSIPAKMNKPPSPVVNGGEPSSSGKGWNVHNVPQDFEQR